MKLAISLSVVLASSSMLASARILVPEHSSSASSRLYRRQVPREHAYDATITDEFRTKCFEVDKGGLADPIFGLLGDKVAGENAADGNGKCVQQRIADQALTNAKTKLTGADQTRCIQLSILYRALERNTGKVGQESLPCEEPVKNQEIQGLLQHQDAAAASNPAHNKAVELDVAKRIAAAGGDPLLAKLTATFAAGDVSDPTGKGKSCNPGFSGGDGRGDDPKDCTTTTNPLVPVASDEELKAAAAGGAPAGGAVAAAPVAPADATATSAPAPAPAKCQVIVTVTATA